MILMKRLAIAGLFLYVQFQFAYSTESIYNHNVTKNKPQKAV